MIRVSPLRLLVPALFSVAVAACSSEPVVIQAGGPQRATTFSPASEVTGSALATDRVVKIDEAQEKQIALLGGVKIGVLTVYNPFNGGAPGELGVWPGASLDAAGLGATHARVIKVDGWNEGGEVRVQYALWHCSPQRWSALPEALKPRPLSNQNDARIVSWATATANASSTEKRSALR